MSSKAKGIALVPVAADPASAASSPAVFPLARLPRDNPEGAASPQGRVDSPSAHPLRGGSAPTSACAAPAGISSEGLLGQVQSY